MGSASLRQRSEVCHSNRPVLLQIILTFLKGKWVFNRQEIDLLLSKCKEKLEIGK